MKLKCVDPLSSFGFSFNLRRYNLGIIFPLGFGIGIRYEFGAPAPIIGYFELEFGFMGCASPVIRRDDGAASRLGGPGDEGAMLTHTHALAHGASKLGDDQMTLDEMIAPYKCSASDPYGPDVTAIKVALYLKLPADFAMMLQLRAFTVGRLFLMFAPKNPVHPVLVTYVVGRCRLTLSNPP